MVHCRHEGGSNTETKGERDGPDLAVSQSPDKEGLLRAKEKNL